MSEPPLHIEFEWDGERWIADVQHTAGLSDEEKVAYRIQQDSFLVHLFHPSGLRSFEMYIDENYQWQTTAALTVDENLLQYIGEWIDHHTA